MANQTLPDSKSARQRLRAEFFVTISGECVPKARPLTNRERHKILERDGRICQRCGVEIVRLGRDVSPFMRGHYGQIDHIFPRARGGQNDAVNLRLLCVTCNAQKGAR